MNGVLTVRAGIDAAGVVMVLGRAAWALVELVHSGTSGCSYIDKPAPRWSAYVYELRKLGIAVETIRESHGGPFPGSHARYVLRSRVTILEMTGDLGGDAA